MGGPGEPHARPSTRTPRTLPTAQLEPSPTHVWSAQVDALAAAEGPAGTVEELTNARTIVTDSQNTDNYTPLIDAVPDDYSMEKARAAIAG